MQAIHYAERARKLDAQGVYNLALSELYVAISWLASERPGLTVGFQAARAFPDNQWVLTSHGRPVISTPIFALVCEAVALLGGKE